MTVLEWILGTALILAVAYGLAVTLLLRWETSDLEDAREDADRAYDVVADLQRLVNALERDTEADAHRLLDEALGALGDGTEAPR